MNTMKMKMVGALAFSAALAAPGGSADAQTTYYVRDLGPVSTGTPVVLQNMQFDVPHSVHLPFRINSKGQVALPRCPLELLEVSTLFSALRG